MKIFLSFFSLLPAFVFGGMAECEIHFSPKDHLADKLVELIDREDKTIKIAIYSFTHVGIAKALERAKMRKVAIEVLVDPFSVKSNASIKYLTDAKIPLFVWDQGIRMNEKRRKALMHNKFCVLGDHTVWTGSFNFTNDAHFRHQENAITLKSQEVSQTFITQFLHMKLYESRPYEEYLALYPKKKRGKKLL